MAPAVPGVFFLGERMLLSCLTVKLRGGDSE